jgi:hypothetical protein
VEHNIGNFGLIHIPKFLLNIFPYCFIIIIIRNFFKYSQLFNEETAIPMIMPLGEERKPAGVPAIVSQKEFERNFDLFTEGSLRNLNWSNIFCAGGAVLAALSPIPERYAKRNKERKQYYHEKAYPASDVDLFVYGLNEEGAKNKLTEIYQAVCDAVPYDVVAIRSKHAITLVSQYPHRHIQVFPITPAWYIPLC